MSFRIDLAATVSIFWLVLGIQSIAVASDLSASSGSLLIARAEEAPPDAPAPLSTSDARIAFGDAGSWSWTVGGGVAVDGQSTDINANVGLGTFLADKFEFTFGIGGWGFIQDGEDAIGGNPTIGFRYHFMPKEVVNVYLEAGIGLLFSDEDVPEDGTSFNFTPRAGVGTLIRLDPESGLRLDLGIRWHHISNASSSGSDDNPARDSFMVYAGLVFPF